VAYLDGDVAYNAAPNGRSVRANEQAARARRIDMLNNPVALVRAALNPSAIVSNLRAEASLQLGGITLATGEKVTLAIDTTSALPTWIRWMAHDENLGDVTYRATFTGYLPVKGVMLTCCAVGRACLSGRLLPLVRGGDIEAMQAAINATPARVARANGGSFLSRRSSTPMAR
jgi:hypothetical protein